MQTARLLWRAAFLVAAMLGSSLALADYSAPKEADWIASDVRLHTGEVIPALRIHYTTVGSPSGERVLVLHGTAGSGTGIHQVAPLAGRQVPDSLQPCRLLRPRTGRNRCRDHGDRQEEIAARLHLRFAR